MAPTDGRGRPITPMDARSLVPFDCGVQVWGWRERGKVLVCSNCFAPSFSVKSRERTNECLPGLPGAESVRRAHECRIADAKDHDLFVVHTCFYASHCSRRRAGGRRRQVQNPFPSLLPSIPRPRPSLSHSLSPFEMRCQFRLDRHRERFASFPSHLVNLAAAGCNTTA